METDAGKTRPSGNEYALSAHGGSDPEIIRYVDTKMPLARAQTETVLGGGKVPVLTLAELPLRRHIVESPYSTGPRLLIQLLGARSGEERQAFVSSAARGLGFERLTYERLNVVGNVPVHTSICVCYGDRSWGQLYCDRGYETIDPRLRVALGSMLPCHWSIGSLRRLAITSCKCETVQAFLDSLENNGLRTGIMFAARGPRPGERSLVGLSSSADESRINDDALMADVLMLAICLHEFVSNYVQWPVVDEQASERLSAMQMQIVHGLVRGLSDRELAAERKLSKHGVDYHLRQLRRHFNARNRVELVRAALRTNSHRSGY